VSKVHEICAIPSKSHLHRLLICAALADRETFIKCTHLEQEGADIKATIGCLVALGAGIERVGEGYNVRPIDRDALPSKCDERMNNTEVVGATALGRPQIRMVEGDHPYNKHHKRQRILDCKESGSTLRFMLPVVCALGISCEFHMSGRLSERPMTHLEDELRRGGVRIWRPSENILCCEGKLASGEYHLPGNISSQYITGMLMALPLLDENSALHVSEPIESQGYIDMTLGVIGKFGQRFDSHHPKGQMTYKISGTQKLTSPKTISTEGDWSNAAFWLGAGAIQDVGVRVSGLDKESAQGDRATCEILTQMGAHVSWDGEIVCVSCGQLRGIEIDASNIPDLIPILSLVASISEGETWITNASRLRLKESDRLMTIADVLNTLGAKVTEEIDGLRIKGVPHLIGGAVDSYNDHRIAMMAGIASIVTDGEVIVKGAEAVDKSYPQFWQVLRGVKNG